MSKKMMKSRTIINMLLATAMIAVLSIWGCGGNTGTSSYTDPTPTTTKTATIITAANLKVWIDEGKLNAPFGSKDRVVVVSPSTSANWTAKGHIAGAVRWDTSELAKSRIEGLAMATNMMPDGPMMDGIIQRLGIDANTTIVISLPKNSSVYDQSLVYWDLRYWGFSKDRLKILNGGDDAWDVAGYALTTDATDKYLASAYSVGKNAALKDIVRYSIGETIATVDSLIATPALKDTWQLIDVRGPAQTPYITNALRLQNATMFMTRLNNDPARNFVYPDRATLESRMATLDVVDGTTLNARVSPTKKTICMCGSSTSASPTFVMFDAVLNVAEGNIAMYDGSASQWNNYSLARLTAKYTSATTAQISAWAFDNALNPRAQGAMPVSTDLSIWSVVAPVLGPTAPDMNQIEKEDKAYMTPITTTTTTGGSGGGSTPGGC